MRSGSSHAMRPIFLTLLLLLSLVQADVDCRAACHSCRAKLDPREILEIYCAMCQECKERRKDRLRTKIELAKQRTSTTAVFEHTTLLEQKLHLARDPEFNESPQATIEAQNDDAGYIMNNMVEDVPEGCPTAPPCSDDEAPPETTLRTTTTTTTSTTTTTQRPCPPIKPCKKKMKPQSVPLPCPYLPPPPQPLCHLPPCAPTICNYIQPPPVPLQQTSYYQYMPPPAMFPHYPTQWLPSPAAEPAPTALAAVNVPPIPTSVTRLQIPTFNSISSQSKKTRTTDANFLYMYVGLPKNIVKSS